MTPTPADPSQGNSSFGQRRAERLAREAEHGVSRRRQLTLHAGDLDAQNDFKLTSTTDDGTSQT